MPDQSGEIGVFILIGMQSCFDLFGKYLTLTDFDLKPRLSLNQKYWSIKITLLKGFFGRAFFFGGGGWFWFFFFFHFLNGVAKETLSLFLHAFLFYVAVFKVYYLHCCY